MTSLKKISCKTSPKKNNIFLDYMFQIQKSKKCNIKDKIGVITPKKSDCYSSSSSKENSWTESKNKKEINEQNSKNKKIIKINIVSSSNKNNSSSPNPFELNNSFYDKENQDPNIQEFKAKQEYYREINLDSVESLIPCKPMLNSTASKAFMNEYSKSKRYQEDKLYFFSTADSIDNNAPKPHKAFFTSTDSKSLILEDEKIQKEMDLEESIKFQESNLPVSLKKKDNENFKILTMKKNEKKDNAS